MTPPADGLRGVSKLHPGGVRALDDVSLARCRHCQSGLTRIVQAATRERKGEAAAGERGGPRTREDRGAQRAGHEPAASPPPAGLLLREVDDRVPRRARHPGGRAAVTRCVWPSGAETIRAAWKPASVSADASSAGERRVNRSGVT